MLEIATLDMASDRSCRDLEQTAALLATGFESLLLKIEDLAHREQYVRSRLDFAYDEYRKLALDHTHSAIDSVDRRDVLRKIKVGLEAPARDEGSSIPLDQIAARYDLEAVFEACRNLAIRSKSRKSGELRDRSAKPAAAVEDFEHDFTTRNGTSSNLECPFARIGNDSARKQIPDPIAAEFHGDGSVGAGTAYAQQNPNKCPIRYLDQHSPEEVTKYFENHKHEIPRSHALCISRYRQNDAKIRQLDAKYGNLQNMIQSLGVKHQQYLPENDEQEARQRGANQPAADVVEKWAENVSRTSVSAASLSVQIREGGMHDGEQERTAQLSERPLREIRLGESPSRPWGISVPLAQEATASAIHSDKDMEQLFLDRPGEDSIVAPKGRNEEERAVGCPIEHDGNDRKPSNGAPKTQATPVEEIGTKEPPLQPQIVFNGPVFFGYSSEQVKHLMQSGSFDFTKR